MNAFGTPNASTNVEVCGWGRAFATRYTYGVGSVATGLRCGAMADIANSGCLILWGYNPSIARLTHATIILEALKRGLRLIVVDPRHAGLASKADLWLRVRPGTDGALALGLCNQMIEHNWYDRDFLRDWSNGPLLVRADTGRFLTEKRPRGWRQRAALFCLGSQPAAAYFLYDSAVGRYERNDADVCDGRRVSHRDAPGSGAMSAGLRALRRLVPALYLRTWWRRSAGSRPSRSKQAARMIWHSRPVSYYAWSGHEQHTNTTQTARAISILYALTGSFDVPGGNVLFPAVPVNSITGEDLPAARQLAPALGFAERPSGQLAGTTSPFAIFTRCIGAAALSGTRAAWFWGEPSAGACRRSLGPRSARRPGVLCACRLVHESDGRNGGCHSTGGLAIRAGSAQGRF